MKPLTTCTIPAILKVKPNVYKTPDTVINEVCSYFKVDYSDILSNSRRSEIVLPRHVCFYFLRRQMRTFVFIGNKFNRDHATVICGERKIQNYMFTKDERVLTALAAIEQKLRN